MAQSYNETTSRMIAAYIQNAAPMRFLSSFFQTPPRNFFDTEEVTIDIQRSDEEVAVVIDDLSTGWRRNSKDLYTNKSFIPPIYKEAGVLNAFELLRRAPGMNPFESPAFQATAISRAFDVFRKGEEKIRRANELQASQVLQTGQVSLIDEAGTVRYAIDFQPKATHFPNAGTAWNGVGADPLADLEALAEVIRDDGLQEPDILIMGADAFRVFIADATVQAHYNNRRIDQGTISPMRPNGLGGKYRGYVEVGNYPFDIWTYGGRYIPADGSAKTEFVTRDKVIMLSSGGRLDAVYGAIPRIVPPDSRVLHYLPSSIQNAEGGMNLFVNAWVSPDGENLHVGAGARPLFIPTAIDTFGTLDTGINP